jgi:hypothetical protein
MHPRRCRAAVAATLITHRGGVAGTGRQWRCSIAPRAQAAASRDLEGAHLDRIGQAATSEASSGIAGGDRGAGSRPPGGEVESSMPAEVYRMEDTPEKIARAVRATF